MKRTWKFNAFISYSQGPDKHLAMAVQDGLRKLGAKKYLLKFRALQIFRDETDLSGIQGLKQKIMKGIDQSEFLVLLASRDGREECWVKMKKDWVAEEIRYWLKSKAIELDESKSPIVKIIICVTSGNIAWQEAPALITNNEAVEDFDWEFTDCLPLELKNVFTQDPQWVDLRGLKEKERELLAKSRLQDLYTFDYPLFKQKIAEISSKIQGDKSVDDLIGEDKRNKRIWGSILSAGIVLLLLLTFVSVWFSVIAKTKQKEAETNLKHYEFKKLQELISDAVAFNRAQGTSGVIFKMRAIDSAYKILDKYLVDSDFIKERQKLENINR